MSNYYPVSKEAAGIQSLRKGRSVLLSQFDGSLYMYGASNAASMLRFRSVPFCVLCFTALLLNAPLQGGPKRLLIITVGKEAGERGHQ